MDILTIQGLHKRFGEKEVLCGLDLAVPEHSIFGFIGRNGAGKTTTMRSVLGLLKPDAGEILVAGEKVIYGQTPTNRHIGYLPDVPEFYSFMTAREYLHLCGESLQLSQKEITERSEELLALVGLADEKHRIRGYSRGMKQRLGIAQALIARPRLLICDEPTSALDPIGRKEILDLLFSVREQTTVLFSTHILSDVERICTDVALLHEGKIAMLGSVESLKSAHRGEGFVLEMCTDDATDAVAKAFAGVCLPKGETLVFSGGEDLMQQVLSLIVEKELPLAKIERTEPTLEALFVEVTGK